MVDIAPTMCHYLGIPFPAQCEGGLLTDALQSYRGFNDDEPTQP